MSAMVCGKRSFFEELPTSPLVSKKLRCASTSPIRLSPSRTNYNPFCQSSSSDGVAALDRLQAIFPQLDIKILERALEKYGDLETSIIFLNGLCSGSADRDFTSATVGTDLPPQENNCSGVAPSEDLSVSGNLPKNGEEWVELIVKVMTGSSDLNNAKTGILRVLGFLEKSICTVAGADAVDNLQKENMMMKEQMEIMNRENGILKRAVSIQHERQKDADNKIQELDHLKHLVAQYQEHVRTLEVNNYALNIQLRHAQQSSSIPGRFHPDVF